MTVLITGAGLVGASVAEHEAAKGHDVVIFDVTPDRPALAKIMGSRPYSIVQGSVVSPFELVETIRRHGIDRVIHTAAIVGPAAQSSPARTVEVNIMGTLNVLEAARVCAVQRVVLCSSASLYYSIEGGEDPDEGSEMSISRPNSVYGTTKQAMENMGLNYVSLFGMDVVVLRLAGVFGPFPSGRPMGQQMLRGLLENALDGTPVVIPRIEIDWIYATDAAVGISKACWAEKLPSRVLNLSMGSVATAEDLRHIILELVPDARVELGDPAIPLPFRRTSGCRVARASKEIGFDSAHDMKSGMKEFLHWIVRERV